MSNLPPFTGAGLLPVGDYPLTLRALRQSYLVTGDGVDSACWDAAWRSWLVDNLGIMVEQLWQTGITDVFVDGSFVEMRDRPHDIDAYFACDLEHYASGRLEHELNALDPYKVWTWDPMSARLDHTRTRLRLPMWHQYRVELYPHWPGHLTSILDEYGNPQTFPAAFRKTRGDYQPKGIVQLIR